jgi:hypothetical protein
MIKLSNYRAAYCTKDGTGYYSLYERTETEYYEVCRVYHLPGESIDQLKSRSKMLTAVLNAKLQKT